MANQQEEYCLIYEKRVAVIGQNTIKEIVATTFWADSYEEAEKICDTLLRHASINDLSPGSQVKLGKIIATKDVPS